MSYIVGISLSRCFSIGVVIQTAALKEDQNTKSITIPSRAKYRHNFLRNRPNTVEFRVLMRIY